MTPTDKAITIGDIIIEAFNKADALERSGFFIEDPNRQPEWSRITGIKVQSKFINKYMAIRGVLYRDESGDGILSKNLYEHSYGHDMLETFKLLGCRNDYGVGNFYDFSLYHRLRSRIVYYGIRPGTPQFTCFLPSLTTSAEELGQSLLEMIQEIYDNGFD